MIIYLGLLSPEDSSDLPGSDSPRQRLGKRGGQPLLPYVVLLSGGVCPDPCYHGNAWSLTPRFHPCPSTSSGRFVFCGTFRPLRAHELRGTLPWRARTFLPSIPPSAGLKGDHLFCSGSSSPVCGYFVFRLESPTGIRSAVKKAQSA
jgi:hypothetical protein